MRNLHAIMGATFQHAKPNLCPFCKHCKPHGEWEGFCEARNKVLSAAPSSKTNGRCKDYVKEEAEG